MTDIAGNGQERFLAQQVARLGDAARRFQRRAFGEYAMRAPWRCRRQGFLDQLAQVGVVDDDLGDAGLDQFSTCQTISGRPRTFSSGFGGVGQRTHPSPRPAAKHGFHGRFSGRRGLAKVCVADLRRLVFQHRANAPAACSV
jgi:hypothetical protein